MDIITLLRWGGEDFGLVVSLLGFCTGMSVLGLFVAVLLHFSLRINGNKRHITTISLISTWLSILRLGGAFIVDVADARGGIYGSLRTAREGMLSRCGCGGEEECWCLFASGFCTWMICGGGEEEIWL